MRRSLDIALYFLNRVDREAGDTISALKLQKLVYYAQVWSMVLRNKPLFEESIEAWKHGPVVRSLWEEYQSFNRQTIPPPEEPLPTFDPSELEVLEMVWGRYGELSAHQLRNLTHAERPWQIARQGLAEHERSSNPLSLEDMRAYHASESPWGDFSPKEKHLLEALVYELLCRPDEFHPPFAPDIEGLKNALLDAIERSHPNYTKEVSEALSEALETPERQPAITAHEFGEWLTNL
jgi:uncharacterized phage-associated protein